MNEKLKKYETIACCGIDCGLCPRFYTKGDAACPGCGGPNFREKHPSCGFVSCCVVKNGFEVCADCHQYPCKRFDPERNGYDSFVTHQKLFSNHEFIKSEGIGRFLEQQKIRMAVLNDLLTSFDDGRSKSFFCLSCALLPLNELERIHREMKNHSETSDLKEKNKRIKDSFRAIANKTGIDLKLNQHNK